MSRKLFATLATVALAAGVCSPVVNAATDHAKSRVKITEGGPDLFEGKVTSKEDACEKGRKVRLFYGGPKGETVVGTAKTDKHGLWAMPGVYYAGTYHAEVQAKRIEDEDDDTLKCGFATGISAQFRSAGKDREGFYDTELRGVHLDRLSTTGRYSGRVKIEDHFKRCLANRTVTVFHLSDPPYEIGKTETDEFGKWELRGPIPPRGTPQRIQVVVSEDRAGHSTCNGHKEKFKLREIESKAAREVKTKVRITEGGPDRFAGKVTSKNDKCLKKRKIRLEYTAGKRGGDVIATTRTDPAGNWAIEQSFYAGIYQVVVLHRVITAHLTCLGGRSMADHY